ncbi:MAG: EAL domain-containing protein [Anaerovoracaceae bacterium]
MSKDKALLLSLKILLETTQDLVYVKDLSFRYIAVSTSFMKLAGVTEMDDVIGKTDFDLFDNEMAQQYREDDRRILETGENMLNYIEQLPRNGETERCSRSSKYIIRDKDEQAVGLYGIGCDVTKQVELEREREHLESTRDEYRIAMEQSNIILASYDIKTKKFYQSEGAILENGLEESIEDFPESVIAQGRVAPGSIKEFTQFYEDMRSGSPKGGGRYQLRDRDDSLNWYTSEYTMRYDVDGKPSHAIITYVNITQEYARERAHLALKRTNNTDERKVMLIADASTANRQALTEIFSSEYELVMVEDGSAVIEALSTNHSISILLLDMILPGKTGIEILREMRVNEKVADIPVVAIASQEKIEYAISALSLGAMEYLITPFDPEMSRICISSAVQKHESIGLRFDNIILNSQKAENQRHQKELRWVAEHDVLTKVYNRDTFMKKAGEMIALKPASYYMLSVFDIDNFKGINNQYGSEQGDSILVNIAESINSDMEIANGIGGRISADIFAYLHPTDAKPKTNPIQRLKLTSTEEGWPLIVSYSLGQIIIDDPTQSINTIYDRACIAKQSVKGKYDTHIAMFDEKMLEKVNREQGIVADMEKALETSQFEMYLQPQYNHSSGSLVGAEALVRWNHPHRGVIPPNVFIPIFEKNGFIFPMDKCVWEQACALLRKWIDNGIEPVPISVNVSRYDLLHQDFFDAITGLVKKYQLEKRLLSIEITESAFSSAPKQIISQVNRLKEYGFTIEIDDFGSGYSSLNTLKDVDTDTIKLDMRFLEEKNSAQRGASIINSIVRMAELLNISVIAEGVETLEQADFLKSVGCEYVQGYLYAKPMRHEDFESLIERCDLEKYIEKPKIISTLDFDAFYNSTSPRASHQAEDILDSIFTGIVIIKMPSVDRALNIYANRKQYEMLKADYKTKNALTFGPGKALLEDKYLEDAFQAIHPEDLQRVKEKYASGFDMNYFRVEDYRLRCEDGSYIWVDTHVVLREITADYRIFYATFINITEEQQLQRALHQATITEEVLTYKAQRDLATGLYNKAATEELINRELIQVANQGKGCSLLLLDMDNLKIINDSFGHIHGDNAINAVAEVLNTNFRATDIIGRIGGDEFMVFLAGTSDDIWLCNQAQKLNEAFDKITLGDGIECSIHCSIGITSSKGARSFEELYPKADSALYRAKSLGKNTFAIYGENVD